MCLIFRDTHGCRAMIILAPLLFCRVKPLHETRTLGPNHPLARVGSGIARGQHNLRVATWSVPTIHSRPVSLRHKTVLTNSNQMKHHAQNCAGKGLEAWNDVVPREDGSVGHSAFSEMSPSMNLTNGQAHKSVADRPRDSIYTLQRQVC